MRIGINASFLRKQNTGIGQVTVNFLKKLAEMSNAGGQASEAEFILYMEEDAELELPKNFFKNIFLPVYKRDDLIRKIWWEKYLLPEKIKKDKCDVFLNLYQSPTVLDGTLQVMLVHDIIPKIFPQYLNNWRKKIYQKLTEKAIKKADKIVAVSHRTEKDLIQHLGIDSEKISVSYVDVDPIYKEEISENENRRVMEKYNLEPGYIYCSGGLEIRKNVEGVMRAYKIIVERSGKIGVFPKLVISGRLMPKLAPLVTDAKQLAEGLEIREHVVLLDFVLQEDAPALYRNALISMFPSMYEGFGLPVLEAMSQGTPVITAKTSSLPEVGADAVLYCDPKNIDEIAKIMRSLIASEELRRTLSEKGKERAKHFSWDSFAEKVLNIIVSIKKSGI